MHTSTVTVAVLDQVSRKEITYNERDFKLEWYSGTGGGGQHRNKHDCSARITHIPTGTVSTAQCRSRENSFKEAVASILQKLNGKAESQARVEQSEIRKSQTGSGERGDKIRTYMFQHGKVTDHQSQKTITTDKAMSGHLNLLW